MTELEVRQKVLDTAEQFLGCKESDGSHKKIIDIYNGHKPLARSYKVKYTDAWCATYVSAVSILCGYTDIMFTECGCGAMIQLYQNAGRWQERDDYVPSPADIIMYDWDDTGAGENKGAPEHVGIVAEVNGNTLTIIEGNKGQAVATRTMAVNGRYIRGYCLPDYASKAESEDDNMTYYKTINDVPNDYRPSVQKLITKGVLKGYGNGEINVSEDFCRTMTVLDRLNLL